MVVLSVDGTAKILSSRQKEQIDCDRKGCVIALDRSIFANRYSITHLLFSYKTMFRSAWQLFGMQEDCPERQRVLDQISSESKGTDFYNTRYCRREYHGILLLLLNPTATCSFVAVSCERNQGSMNLDNRKNRSNLPLFFFLLKFLIIYYSENNVRILKFYLKNLILDLSTN